MLGQRSSYAACHVKKREYRSIGAQHRVVATLRYHSRAVSAFCRAVLAPHASTQPRCSGSARTSEFGSPSMRRRSARLANADRSAVEQIEDTGSTGCGRAPRGRAHLGEKLYMSLQELEHRSPPK